jgi:SOS-response transcriptional repressor LexA
MKKRTEPTQIEYDGLLDIGELVTGGRDGCVSYRIDGESVTDDIRVGDLVTVDPTAEIENGSLVLQIKNGRNTVQKSSLGLRLVTKNGDPVEAQISSDCCGKIIYLLRAIDGGAR